MISMTKKSCNVDPMKNGYPENVRNLHVSDIRVVYRNVERFRAADEYNQ